MSGIADDARQPGEGFSGRLEELIRINDIQNPNLIIENEQLLLRNDGQRPTILLPSAGVELVEGQSLYMPVGLQGLLCDSSFFLAVHLPPGASFRNSVLEWTPKEVQYGVYYVTFMAQDNNIGVRDVRLRLSVRSRPYYELATDTSPKISYKAIPSAEGTVLTVDGRSGLLLQNRYLEYLAVDWALKVEGSNERAFLRLHARFGKYQISWDEARLVDHFRRVRTLNSGPPFNFDFADTWGDTFAYGSRIPEDNYWFISVAKRVEKVELSR